MALAIPSINLKQISLQPITFTPTEYTPETVDVGILERSLSKMEARRKDAYQEKSKLDITLGQIGTQLNEAEREWYNNYINDSLASVEEQITAGNYGDAALYAVNQAGLAARSPILQAKMTASKKYEDLYLINQQRANNGKVSQDDFNYWIKHNPYSFSTTYDVNGNESGGTLNEPNILYDSIDLVNDLFVPAAKLVEFSQTSKTSKSEGGTTKADGSYYRGGRENSSSVQSVNAENILQNVKELMKQGDMFGKVEQYFKTQQYKFEQLDELINTASSEEERLKAQNEKDNYTKLMYRNGQAVTNVYEFLENLVYQSDIIDNLSYRRTSIVSGTSGFNGEAQQSEGIISRGGGSLGAGLGVYPNRDKEQGSNIWWKLYGGTPTEHAANAANGIMSIMPG